MAGSDGDLVLIAYDGDNGPVHFKINTDLEIKNYSEEGMRVSGDLADSSPEEPWFEGRPDSSQAGWYAKRVEVDDVGE